MPDPQEAKAHTPWRVLTERESPSAVRIVAAERPTNEYHAEISYTGGDSEELAEFIVRACNSHEELMAVLEGLLDFANAVTSEPRPGAVQRAAAVLRGERNA